MTGLWKHFFPFTLPKIALLGLFLAAALQTQARAEDKSPSSVLIVTATGKTNAAPDLATLNLSVVREAKTAREALNANSKAMASVLEAMKKAGVTERDLQTSNFNIQPKYLYPKATSSGQQKPPRIVGYVVTNQLAVTVRQLEKVGSLLDEAVTLGVNSGGGISFGLADPAKLERQAREKAMAAAIDKAETLAKAAGTSLGRVLEIREGASRVPRAVFQGRQAEASISAARVPVAAGETTSSVSVTVRWELR